MLEFLGDLASGGVVGLVGSLASNVVAFFRNRQDQEHSLERLRVEHDCRLREMAAEAKYRTEQTRLESETQQAAAEYQAMVASYQQDQAYSGDSRLLRVAEFVRRMTRPVLTFALVGLTAAIYWTATEAMQDVIARAVVTMTATALSWWFADRAIAKRVAGKVL